MTHDDRSIERHHCVERQLAQRDITDERVLDAMRTVPRHRFVSSDLAAFAYDDRPLPIGHDATISQPYIVALMAQALAIRPSDRVLEVGAGSGYAAAVMAELAAEVIAVECVEPLCELAARHLESYRERVQVVCADGSLGYPPGAPYDAISVAAAAPKIPLRSNSRRPRAAIGTYSTKTRISETRAAWIGRFIALKVAVIS